MGFDGFPQESVAFLAGIREHNERAWFEAHRDEYDAYYVGAARDFVIAAGERLRAIAPGVHADPKVLGSIGRINRDTRFSADKRLYKDHLDIGFPEGERKTAASAFFFRLTPEGVGLGLGAHAFDKARLPVFRAAVADRGRGAALAAAVRQVGAAGYAVLGEELKRTPPGYPDVDGEREPLLRYTSLWTVVEEPLAAWLQRPDAVDRALNHWQAMLPLHRWLVDTLA